MWLNRNIFGFGLASFFADISHEMTTALLPLVVTSLVGPALAPSLLGVLTGTAEAIASCTKPFFGWFSDIARRRKPLVVTGYAITGIFLALIGTVTRVWQLFLYKCLAWSGKGLREPTRDALIASSIAPQYYGRAFGFHRAMDTMGAIIGPVIAWLLIGKLSIGTIFLLTAVPGACSVAAIIFLTREEPVPVSGIPTTKINFFTTLSLLPHAFRYFVAVMFLFACGNFHRTLIILRFQELPVITTSVTILLYMLYNIVRASTEMGMGYLGDYYQRKTLLALFGFGGFMATLIGLMLPPSLLLCIIIMVTAGVSVATVGALERSIAASLLPAEVRATGFGLLQMADGVGMLLASSVVGLLWTGVSAMAGFGYALVIVAGAVVLLLRKD